MTDVSAMEKLDMASPDGVSRNIEQLATLFPNCVTETAEGKKIDFDLLRQELSDDIVEGTKERYRLEWAGKREAIVTANLPTTNTLRPVREDSVDFDTTENLYIEGDNLEVLKLLQESYFNSIKVIYIDPPYNRGEDLIYKDDYSQTVAEFKSYEQFVDEYNNRLVTNPETSGRLHSDWLTLMYPRLKLANNLLEDEGVIFISIGDHEVHNLRKICDNVFGEGNFVATLVWDTNHSAQAGLFKVYHQYVLVYAKKIESLNVPKSLNDELFEAGAMKKESPRHPMQKFTFPKGTRFDADDGYELFDTWGEAEKVILHNGKMRSQNGVLIEDVTLEAAWTQANQMKQFFYGDKESLVDSRGQRVVDFYFTKTGKLKIVKQRGVNTPQTTLKYSTQGVISKKLADLFELADTPFDSPKPTEMIQDFINWFAEDDSIILDFFSGSGTTAHAVFNVNSLDEAKNVKFILVQIPEKTGENSVAHKAGYNTICSIAKERIRRVANKLKNTRPDIDLGFRVFKVDTSNMQDVYYNPQNISQDNLELFVDNIKVDRTADDLVTQIMLDWGLPLSLPIERMKILDKEVISVASNSLFACFDSGIDEAFAKEVATHQPLRIVFRDRSFTNDTAKENVRQLLKQLSPATEMRVL